MKDKCTDFRISSETKKMHQFSLLHWEIDFGSSSYLNILGGLLFTYERPLHQVQDRISQVRAF